MSFPYGILLAVDQQKKPYTFGGCARCMKVGTNEHFKGKSTYTLCWCILRVRFSVFLGDGSELYKLFSKPMFQEILQ